MALEEVDVLLHHRGFVLERKQQRVQQPHMVRQRPSFLTLSLSLVRVLVLALALVLVREGLLLLLLLLR